jgi:hypothetical protein
MQLREQQRAVAPVQAPAFSGRVVSSKAQPKAPAAADSSQDRGPPAPGYDVRTVERSPPPPLHVCLVACVAMMWL